MTDKVNVYQSAFNVTESEHLSPYTKVTVVFDSANLPGNAKTSGETEIHEYTAGNTLAGQEIEFECPWGTQEIANNVLSAINGYRYKPYTVESGMLDPSIEIGDGVTTNGVYGGLYKQDIDFGHMFVSDYSAPQEEQMNHEYVYESKSERTIKRQDAHTRAEFKATSISIEAKVSKEGGEVAAHSFGWKLLDDSFTLYSNNKAVFTCDKDGITVDGTINARSGYIGSDANGFHITEHSIWNGKPDFTKDGKSKNGVYIGDNGIALGTTTDNKNHAFSVDKDGNLVARKATIYGNGEFTGTIYCDCLQVRNQARIGNSLLGVGCVDSDQINSGAVVAGKIGTKAVDTNQLEDGAVETDKIDGGAVTKTKTGNAVQNSLTNADTVKDWVDAVTADTATISKVVAKKLFADTYYLSGIELKVYTVKDTGGTERKVLGYTGSPA